MLALVWPTSQLGGLQALRLPATRGWSRPFDFELSRWLTVSATLKSWQNRVNWAVFLKNDWNHSVFFSNSQFWCRKSEVKVSSTFCIPVKNPGNKTKFGSFEWICCKHGLTQNKACFLLRTGGVFLLKRKTLDHWITGSRSTKHKKCILTVHNDIDKMKIKCHNLNETCCIPWGANDSQNSVLH